MKHPWVFLLAIAAIPGANSGCGSSSSGGRSSGTGRLSQAEFPTAYTDAVCGSAARCCQLGGIHFDPAACGARASSDFGNTFAARAALEGVTFDADAAARCLSAMSALAMTCDPTYQVRHDAETVCAGALVGDRAIGAACQDDVQCAGASAKTARCNNTFDDLGGAPSSGAPAPNTCIATTVLSGPPSAKLGDACSGTQGSYLLGNDLDGGVWWGAPVNPEGSGGSGGGGGGPAPGALFCTLNDGAYCDPASFVCVPAVADGGACSYPNTTPFCSVASFCRNEVCVPRLDVGAPCLGYDCKDDLRCSLSRQVCIAVGETGASCASSDECKSSQCIGGVCAPSLPFGLATCDGMDPGGGGDISGSVGGGNPTLGAGGGLTAGGAGGGTLASGGSSAAGSSGLGGAGG